VALSLITPDSLNLAQDYAGMGFGGTGSANQLDDYEEGTWTPTSGVTLTVSSATYTKIGRLVYLNADLTFTSSSSGSAAIISGLPFTPSETYSTGSFNYHTASSHLDATVNVSSSGGIEFRSAPNTGSLTYTNTSNNRFIFNAIYNT